MAKIARGARRSPNIWGSPHVYELENRAVDPGGVLEPAMWDKRPWSGGTVLDVGCGTGFHLPRFAEHAGRVIGVEPHDDLAERARRRCAHAGARNVDVRRGTAQNLPLPDACVDVVHVRWAYFFGPGCEPGLAELDRVVRRGGAAFIIDNDASRGTFAGWFRRAFPNYEPRAVETFWAMRDWNRESLDMGWRFERRADFEAVVRIEFCPEVAEAVIARHTGLEVDYAVNLWWRQF